MKSWISKLNKSLIFQTYGLNGQFRVRQMHSTAAEQSINKIKAVNDSRLLSSHLTYQPSPKMLRAIKNNDILKLYSDQSISRVAQK